MGTAPSKAGKTKVQPVEPVLYYVRVGSKDVVTIDRLPTETLSDVREEITEEVGGFRLRRAIICESARRHL